MPETEKIYVGSGKEHKFPDGGSSIKVSVCLDGLGKLFEQYGYTTKSGKKYLNLIVQTRREPGQYGETHSVTIDTWKPPEKQG
jgi:hypothetical protein